MSRTGCVEGFGACLPAIAAQLREVLVSRPPSRAASAHAGSGVAGGKGGGAGAAGGQGALGSAGISGASGGGAASSALSREGHSNLEALQCVGTLASALGPMWKPYALQLVEPMMLTGLSETLVGAVRKVRG